MTCVLTPLMVVKITLPKPSEPLEPGFCELGWERSTTPTEEGLGGFETLEPGGVGLGVEKEEFGF